VLTEACRQLATWSEVTGRDDLVMSVNASPHQLRDAELVGAVAEALAESGLEPERVWVEITESAMLDDSGRSLRALQALHHLGVRLAADDFGTGYSSLSYLKRFPISEVKIDRTFVNGLGGSRDDEAIVSAVIAMAKVLQLEIVAEGVETPRQRDCLLALGCERAQGFMFSKPVPAEDAGALLEVSPSRV
jgi:EAL domain-containing protein (putative c-di-GMP-specific phosphodiesterase class I)